MNINLHIERLVLDSLDIVPSQRHSLQAAVETKLTRLLTERGLAPRSAGGGALPRVASPAIQFNAAAGPTDLGRQIAGTAYGGIGK